MLDCRDWIAWPFNAKDRFSILFRSDFFSFTLVISLVLEFEDQSSLKRIFRGNWFL